MAFIDSYIFAKEMILRFATELCIKTRLPTYLLYLG